MTGAKVGSLGLYGNLGLQFEYGSSVTDIKAIETGLTFDVYGKEIPIMAFTDNNSVYFTVYINLLFGRKW